MSPVTYPDNEPRQCQWLRTEARSPWASACSLEPLGQRCRAALSGLLAVVVGAGASGRGAARLLHTAGASVRVLERNPQPLAEPFASFVRENTIEVLHGEHTPEQFAGAAMVVLSPGVPVRTIAPFLPTGDAAPEIMAELELASRFIKEPVVAVTGTNGKTTTATLVADMLAYAGRKVFLGGNIGTPLSDYVLDGVDGGRADVLVLEVSSFQLQTCSTFKPWAAALLNVSDNHLDYHADMGEYLCAKLNLFVRMDEDGLAVFPESMRAVIESQQPTRARIHYYEAKGRFHTETLPGPHNQANMEAAYQLVRFFGVTECEALAVIHRFKKQPHRLEAIVETDGVLYVNDSKGTTIEAVRAALQSYDRPILLLAGGKFKGGDLPSLAPLVRERVRHVALFGASREKFESAWAGAAPMTWDATLEEAMRRLAAMARAGDVVLLSPGTSSFDLYKDYLARGDDFRRVALAIAAASEGGAA
ncbi:MAG: UDP-N-acetylmuramoyl-L-alanine--D-glutamate ligase [Desulfovibrionaceae bacterium]